MSKLFVTDSFLPPYEDFEKYLREIWEANWLTNRGNIVKQLETALEKHLQTKNLLAVSNGTIALQIAIEALEVRGEIITTPFTYIATISSQLWQGCTPVFADIEDEYLCIDPAKVEAAITPSTGAIMPTHVFGNPCDIEALEAIGKKHNIPVIYDAAHCFGINYKGQSIVNYGDASTLSFHATKLFHTAEGGAIVTAEKKIYDRCFALHNFGHEGEEAFQAIGINGKLSELHAAMGLAVMPYIHDIIEHRKSASALYDLDLKRLPCKRIPIRPGTDYNYAYLPVLFEDEQAMQAVKDALNAQDIFPRRYFYPAINTVSQLPYQEMPVAENIASRILCLPLSATIQYRDIERICTIIRKTLSGS